MLEDIGRCHLALREYEKAEEHLKRALDRAKGWQDIRFYALKDLALCAIARGDFEGARARIEEAEGLASELDLPHIAPLIEAVRGEWEASAGRPEGIARVAQAAETFAALNIPDHLIYSQLVMARLSSEAGRKGMAEQALLRAMEGDQSRGISPLLVRGRGAHGSARSDRARL